MCRWSTCTPSAPAAARSPRVDAAGHAAGRAGERRRRSRADLLRPRRHASRPSPTPTWCSAGSTRRRCSRSTSRCRSSALRGDLRRHGRPRRSASTPKRPPRPRSGSPTRRWPARSAWCRCRAATTRATSRCSPSAAPGRCTPSALARELGLPEVLVPARPGITNALGCVVADLRHDFVNTLNEPLDGARHGRASRASSRQQRAARRGDQRPRSARDRRDRRAALRRHAVPRPDASHPRGPAVAPASRATSCRRCSRRPISPASRCGCRKSARSLVNLNTSVDRQAPALLDRRADRSGRRAAAPARTPPSAARRSGSTAAGTTPGLRPREAAADALHRGAGDHRADRRDDRDRARRPAARVDADRQSEDHVARSAQRRILAGGRALDPHHPRGHPGRPAAGLQRDGPGLLARGLLAGDRRGQRPLRRHLRRRRRRADRAGRARPAGVRRHHAVLDRRADRADRRGRCAGAASRATSTSSTTPISAART